MASTETSARVIKDIAVQGKPIGPGEIVTKEQCGDAWDKWVRSGAIEVVKASGSSDKPADADTKKD